MSEKLKPCPFCGGEQIKVQLPVTSFGAAEFSCANCPAIVRFMGHIRLRFAAEAWNSRDGDTGKQLIERLGNEYMASTKSMNER